MGGRSLKNNTPEALTRRRTAHPRRSDRRAPWKKEQKEPKRLAVTTGGVCGCGAREAGRGAADARLRHNEVERLRPGDDVASARAAEESSRSPAERPPNHQRASDGATRAGALVFDSGDSRTRHPLARGVTERSFALAPGWSSDFTDRPTTLDLAKTTEQGR